ncbi:hypothetical protein ACF0H5_001201 [Mactra antiquata]
MPKSKSGTYKHITENIIRIDETKIIQFQEKLKLKQNDINKLEVDIGRNEDINVTSNTFIGILKEISTSVFGKIRKTQSNPVKKVHDKKPWFNHECYEARAMYKRARNAFIKHKDNQQLRENYISLKNKFNKIKRKQKKRYNYQERIQLNKMSKSEPLYVFLGTYNAIVDMMTNMYDRGLLDTGEYIVIYFDHETVDTIDPLDYYRRKEIIN